MDWELRITRAMKRRSASYSVLQCPYSECLERTATEEKSPASGRIVRKGFFYRSSDRRRVARFLCKRCKRSFSLASSSACFMQKKRQLNSQIRELLCSGVSQRRIAKLLKINRKTVVRKLLFLAEQAQMKQQELLSSLQASPLTRVQFDEMESFERSKCLPLSIPLAVEEGTRRILAFRVCSMPAKGPLAAISMRKYGPRADDRPQAAQELLRQIAPILAPGTKLTTDQNPKYPAWVNANLLQVSHHTVKGRIGCVVGQGELKKIGWDPLFALNHSCAMIRANVNRLFRRTWCTTKRTDRLAAHLSIYVDYHNSVLLQA